MDKTEVKIMSTCGSDRAIDDVVEDYASRGWTSVKHAGGVVVEKTTAAATTVATKVKDVVPMVVPARKKTTKDVLDELAQDKDLAAALHYVYMNPCIKVTVTEIKESMDVVCDGKAPLVSTRLKNDSALKAGMCGQARKPAPMSAMSRMKSFVLKATSTKLVTVS